MKPQRLTARVRARAYRVCIVMLSLTLFACGGGGGGGSSSAAGPGSGSGSSSGSSSSSGSGSTTIFTPGTSQSVSALYQEVWPPATPAAPTSCITQPMTGVHTYNVGSGQTYTTLTSVPWLSLQAGDVVNIFPGTYATKIALNAIGTATAPVIINGVTDSSCTRPVITGVGAVTATSDHGFFLDGQYQDEDAGIIYIHWGQNGLFGNRPGYITIQNLEISGANPNNSYTNQLGTTQKWGTFSSGIYAREVSHLTVQNCVIHDNDLGIFTNTQNDDSQEFTDHVVIRRNYIYNNGVANDDHEHNLYVQGVRTLYEGNYIGQLIATSVGASLKDRSSGTVIRYNTIIAAARAIDLVDSEGGGTSVIPDPLYNYAWVYGNKIVSDFTTDAPNVTSSTLLVHWGGDSSLCNNYRSGTLFFFFNTVYMNGTQAQTGGSTIDLFDIPVTGLNHKAAAGSNYACSSTGAAPATTPQIVDARSNIIWTGTGNAGYEVGYLDGTILFNDTNWVNTNYAQNVGDTNGNFVTVTVNGTLIQGNAPALDANFTPTTAIGNGTAPTAAIIPAGIPANEGPTLTSLQVVNQYEVTNPVGVANYVVRPNMSDLGAVAYP